MRLGGDVLHRRRIRQQRTGAADDLAPGGDVRQVQFAEDRDCADRLDLPEPLMELVEPALAQGRRGRSLLANSPSMEDIAAKAHELLLEAIGARLVMLAAQTA